MLLSQQADLNTNQQLAKKIKLARTERDSFMATYDVISKDLLDGLALYRLPENGKEWIRNMLDATVPGGKMNRGLTVPSALESILKRELTADELFQSQVLGWCIEFENVGMVAINDSFIVEAAIYQMLKKYFKTHPAYGDFLELFHEVTYQTELGQLMDLITAPEGDVDLDRFSIEKHAYIVEFKTAYYSFYLPIALAMRLAGITEERAYIQARDVLLPLGEYFQVQDDYLDCYGTPETIGKIGTDIEDNKCGWLIVQALSRASPEQRTLLDQCYGKKNADSVAIVKNVYKELEIERIYHEYEEESYKRISVLIEKIEDGLIPRDMFVTFMNRIYKRKV
ncbi:Farnesyl pyrophosphate synthetase [Batrachochytrium dendrobatidis]